LPSHELHDKISVVLLVIIIPALLYFKIDLITIAIFSISFWFGSRFLSPDLDLDSRIYKRWKLARFIWCPYRDLFKHRGCSHNILLGPISLIGYFGALVLLIVYIASGTILEYHEGFLVVVAGMVLAIETHIITDKLMSKKKKK